LASLGTGLLDIFSRMTPDFFSLSRFKQAAQDYRSFGSSFQGQRIWSLHPDKLDTIDVTFFLT